jgi:hypothetical protein
VRAASLSCPQTGCHCEQNATSLFLYTRRRPELKSKNLLNVMRLSPITLPDVMIAQ